MKESPLDLSNVEVGDGIYKQTGPKEDQLRDIVRGLRSDYELTTIRRFVYPLYRVELALESKSGIVWIDGVTGEETNL